MNHFKKFALLIFFSLYSILINAQQIPNLETIGNTPIPTNVIDVETVFFDNNNNTYAAYAGSGNAENRKKLSLVKLNKTNGNWDFIGTENFYSLPNDEAFIKHLQGVVDTHGNIYILVQSLNKTRIIQYNQQNNAWDLTNIKEVNSSSADSYISISPFDDLNPQNERSLIFSYQEQISDGIIAESIDTNINLNLTNNWRRVKTTKDAFPQNSFGGSDIVIDYQNTFRAYSAYLQKIADDNYKILIYNLNQSPGTIHNEVNGFNNNNINEFVSDLGFSINTREAFIVAKKRSGELIIETQSSNGNYNATVVTKQGLPNIVNRVSYKSFNNSNHLAVAHDKNGTEYTSIFKLNNNSNEWELLGEEAGRFRNNMQIDNNGIPYLYFTNDKRIRRVKQSSLSTKKIVTNLYSTYPNPVQNILTINTHSLIKNIKIYDINGRFLQESKNTNTINLDSYKPGIYILNITDNKNKVSVNKILKN